MKYNYSGIEYKIELIDDGTMDTVLRVNGSHEVRFDSDYARTDEGGIVEQAITDAIEDYLEKQIDPTCVLCEFGEEPGHEH